MCENGCFSNLGTSMDVRFGREWRDRAGPHCIDIDLNFYERWGKTVAHVGCFHTADRQCVLRGFWLTGEALSKPMRTLVTFLKVYVSYSFFTDYNSYGSYGSYGSYHFYNGENYYIGAMAMDGFLVTFAILEMGIAIATSILGCVVVCCSSRNTVRMSDAIGHTALWADSIWITRLNNIGSLIIKMRRSMRPSHLYNRNSYTNKTTWTLPEKVMEYLESTMKTLVFWFAGNGLAPTTNKYYDFNATLMCSVRANNAIGKVRNSIHTIESIGMCHFIYSFIYFIKKIRQLQGYPSLHCESTNACIVYIQ